MTEQTQTPEPTAGDEKFVADPDVEFDPTSGAGYEFNQPETETEGAADRVETGTEPETADRPDGAPTDEEIAAELAAQVRYEKALAKIDPATGEPWATLEEDTDGTETETEPETVDEPAGPPTDANGDLIYPDEKVSPDPVPGEEPAVSYSAATVKSLTELLTAAGLEHTGNKPELYARAASAGLLNAHQGRPSTYTVGDETHYSQVAAKFNIANYRELGALNGVHNSRYELSRGDVVQLPAPKRG